MVTRVPTTKEYLILTNSHGALATIARKSLGNFSIEKLKQAKLVNSNFKTGLDFTDRYDRSGVKRLFRILVSTINKQIPFLEKSISNDYESPNYDYISIIPSSTPSLKIILTYETSTLRYLRKLDNHLELAGLPFRLDFSDAYQSRDYINLYVTLYSINSNNRMMSVYKTLFFIPEILSAIKTLSRKARFTNAALRTLNRRIPVRRPQNGSRPSN